MRLCFFVFFLVPLVLFANPGLEREFYLSCQEDENCRETLDGIWGGEVRYPDQKVAQLICENKQKIISASKMVPKQFAAFQWIAENFSFFTKGNELYIKPEIMAACLMAEHMILYQFRDAQVDLSLKRDSSGQDLVKAAQLLHDPNFTIEDVGSVSVGDGQIHVNSARNLYLIKNQPQAWDPKKWQLNEGFAYPSIPQMLGELVSESHYQYVAMKLAEVVTGYARFANSENGGFAELDLRERADLQCTLYNLGGARAKALNRWQKIKEKKEAGLEYSQELPTPNYYGLYAQLVLEQAHDLINGDACEQ